MSGSCGAARTTVCHASGLTVEIGNTDAEGRLVLCDLLDEACEEMPALLVDCATLTGAARVALGPDLPALFCNDDAIAESTLRFGHIVHDPLWRLPLWAGYDDWLKSNIADLNNVSSKPMAGAVTAALYLRHFVKARYSLDAPGSLRLERFGLGLGGPRAEKRWRCGHYLR